MESPLEKGIRFKKMIFHQTGNLLPITLVNLHKYQRKTQFQTTTKISLSK